MNNTDKNKTGAGANVTADKTSKGAEVVETNPETGKRKIKLNGERFKDVKYEMTNRSKDEESESKPRGFHRPQGEFFDKKKPESDGYYLARQMAFTLTKKEFRTPQANLPLITDWLKSKGVKLTDKNNFVAGSYGYHFRPAESADVVVVDLRKVKTAEQLLAKFAPAKK